VTTMTDTTSQAGGSRSQHHDDRARPAIEAKVWTIALIAFVVLLAGLSVVGMVVDLTWR
jgi:hypothetical protein